MTELEEQIEQACAVLAAGGIILYPTDTVWGIGCDATNASAVERIYRLKRRADNKAMILLVPDKESVVYLTGSIPAAALPLVTDPDRPTTVVYDRCSHVAHNLKGADGSVGIRITREAFSHGLCRKFGKPIVSTSANISGAPAARCFSEIGPEVLGGVDFAVNIRRDETDVSSRPSRVIKVTAAGEITVLRP